jgi:ribosomal protein S18 acetylase RimI-like enzyme
MIRVARSSDAKQIAPLLMNAMKELAIKYVNDTDPMLAIPLFERFVGKKNNQYSYENMNVYCIGDQIAGVINGYDGKDFSDLRVAFLTHVNRQFQSNLPNEAETEAGEYYIDALSVIDSCQGKGIGKALLQEAIQEAKVKGFTKVGLLVEKDNGRAAQLYMKLGFEVVAEKEFLGESYLHLQFTP